MIPSLKDYYYTLLATLERIEEDKTFVSQLYLDVADAFSKLKFSFDNNENVIEPFAVKSLSLFIKEQQPEEELGSLAEIRYVIKSEPDFQNAEIVQKANEVLERSKIKKLW